MNIGVVIEAPYLGQDHVLADVGRQLVHLGMQPDFAARPDLVTHIDLGREAVSDDDHRQGWQDAASFQCLRPSLPFPAYRCRDGIAVYNNGSHIRGSMPSPATT